MSWKNFKQVNFGSAKIRSYQTDQGDYVAWINLGDRTLEASGSSQKRAIEQLKRDVRKATR